MSEVQKNKGKPQGIGDEEYNLPPSQTWASDQICQKVCSILSRYGRFIHFHPAGSTRGIKRRKTKKPKKNSFHRIKKSPKNKPRIIDDESFQKIINAQSLWLLAELIDIFRNKDKCYIFFFRQIPLGLNEDIDQNILDQLTTLDDVYLSTLFKLRKLLEPQFISELIVYLSEICMKKKLLKDLIINRNKNANLQTADRFVQYAFAKYLNDQNIFKKYTNEVLIAEYEQFYQQQQQFIIDSTFCLLQPFENIPFEDEPFIGNHTQTFQVENEQQENSNEYYLD